MTSPVQARQIRFVYNEGEPPPKRRRINAACKTCRKRKTRCDGTKPYCLTCTDNGHECLGFADETERNSGPNGNRHMEESKEAFGKRRMTEPGVNREHQERPLQPRTKEIPEDGRAMSMGSVNRKVYEPDGKADYRDINVFVDGPSPTNQISPDLERHRVPYFRYFGPTAIIPGFKQMVVSIREHHHGMGAGSSASIVSSRSSISGSAYDRMPAQPGTDTRSPTDMPMYDQADELPINRLIIHLVETFFTHLGCNYPFLRKTSFIRRVEERSVEPILVDAVCALAARFSDHRLLTAGYGTLYPKSDYGHAFAQRAKAAIVDTFPCPTIAAVQACLLLAYEGFGANQDSALWMYLGCAIRMAEDLGLQKLDGVKHQGQKDPVHRRAIADDSSDVPDAISVREKLEIEQERSDTFWSVFMLDRVIAAGTGRTSTLKDQDLELSFPSMTPTSNTGPPDPFPALIQIIHLNGRVSDILNNIRDVRDMTPSRTQGLITMEKELTSLYQKLDSRLTFNAVNFQNSVKIGSGINFILVHFWFHTLIMLLHQPTLMHTFEGQILQLLPNSRELSMSSAKTIADILAFAELIDPGSFIGNPFTCQPIYVAACAFLSESEAHTSSQPASRDASPPPIINQLNTSGGKKADLRQKHSLLAAAAKQNYQRCYKALQQLEVYWAGVRYVLVTLDQRAEGIADPETYTQQEYESTKVKPDIVPSWRRKLSQLGPMSPQKWHIDLPQYPRVDLNSPAIDPSKAIGWSLTGTTNSPNSNLTFMYTNSEQTQPPIYQSYSGASNMVYDPIRQSLPESVPGSTSTSDNQPQSRYPTRKLSMVPPEAKYSPILSNPATTSDAEMLLGLQNSTYVNTPTTQQLGKLSTPHADRFDFLGNNNNVYPTSPGAQLGLGGVGDVMMESQEIDMSSLGGDMMPWLEDYLPQDILQFFDGANGSAAMMGNDEARDGE